MYGRSPGSRVIARHPLPSPHRASGYGWALTAYSRGGGCGIDPGAFATRPHRIPEGPRHVAAKPRCRGAIPRELCDSHAIRVKPPCRLGRRTQRPEDTVAPTRFRHVRLLRRVAQAMNTAAGRDSAHLRKPSRLDVQAGHVRVGAEYAAVAFGRLHGDSADRAVEPVQSIVVGDGLLHVVPALGACDRRFVP